MSDLLYAAAALSLCCAVLACVVAIVQTAELRRIRGAAAELLASSHDCEATMRQFMEFRAPITQLTRSHGLRAHDAFVFIRTLARRN